MAVNPRASRMQTAFRRRKRGPTSVCLRKSGGTARRAAKCFLRKCANSISANAAGIAGSVKRRAGVAKRVSIILASKPRELADDHRTVTYYANMDSPNIFDELPTRVGGIPTHLDFG